MPKRVLTYRRANWVRSRNHTGVMRGIRLALPAGVAARYAAKLRKLSDEMTATTEREIEALFKHADVEAFFAKRAAPLPQIAMDISPASQARILTNDLKRRFEQLYGSEAPDVAKTMTAEADDASAEALTKSLKELSGGLKLDVSGVSNAAMEEFSKSAIAAQVSLIRSIPEEYFLSVQQAVLRSITTGKGLADLKPFFEQHAGEVDRRSKNIAIDQTHKAYNGLNAERMKAVGLNKFEWIHSGGGIHPRIQHLDDFNGRVYSFDKLPIDEGLKVPVKPGDAPNCRCTILPILEFKDGAPV
jgi:uncharacterized protein with gpF-like domain